MANTIRIAIMKQAQVEFYVDGWPHFTSIAGRILSPTVSYKNQFQNALQCVNLYIYIIIYIILYIYISKVADIVLYTSSKSKAVELLQDGCILKSTGSHKKGGGILPGIMLFHFIIYITLV